VHPTARMDVVGEHKTMISQLGYGAKGKNFNPDGN
jgi:hypothetical protein